VKFYNIKKMYTDSYLEDRLNAYSKEDVLRVLSKDKLNHEEFLCLLSSKAAECLEQMARKANEVTIRNFGRVIQMYTPLYLANYCVNKCVYCSFNFENDIKRSRLSLDEVESEAKAIYENGFKHILILTGESRTHSPVSYIKDCVDILKKYFSSINIEVYPLETTEYKELVDAGVDGMTIYQEVYDEDIYKKLHLSGPKRIYENRIDAPQRALEAGMRTVNIGALIGLNEWRQEAFFTGIHAEYLQNMYLDTEISISLPRIRPHIGSFSDVKYVSDKDLVQILLALRLFMPRAGITLSTRERAEFRDNLIGLGITKISAGSVTSVGGHSADEKTKGQFDISDERGADEMKNVIYKKGYQPIFKDWHNLGI
jgi:2-iminoacetate synthase